jgi:hypothetical protein
MKKRNVTKIKITSIHSDGMCGIPARILLQRFCLLRYCEKVGDSESVNNYQLGLLREHGVEFDVIEI